MQTTDIYNLCLMAMAMATLWGIMLSGLGLMQLCDRLRSGAQRESRFALARLGGDMAVACAIVLMCGFAAISRMDILPPGLWSMGPPIHAIG